jgi:hypothetical protein
MIDFLRPCTKSTLGSFRSPKHYADSMTAIVEVLKACGMPLEQALALYSSGPEGIHAYYTTNDRVVCSEWLLNMVKPSLTPYNRVGKWFAMGTTCDCCLGYRVALAVAAWPLFFVLGRVF